MVDWRTKNIRKLPTKELKTYNSAYASGQVFKFARDEANAELKRREEGRTIPKRKIRNNRNPFDFGF